MKNNSRRLRHFNLVLYCSKYSIERILMLNSQRIHHCCYICHDKDVYDSDLINEQGEYVHKKGDVEKVHFHMLISFYNAHTFTAVKRMFTTKEDNPRVEPVNDMCAMYRYLTHLDHPNKYQYSSEEIIYSVDEQFYKDLLYHGDTNDNDNKALAIVKDILKGTNPILMIHRYGRDYAIHMKQYKDVADEVLSWQVNHPTERNAKVFEEEIEQMGL